MLDVYKTLYHSAKWAIEQSEYKMLSISREQFDRRSWRFLFMDESGCPFTLDSFYLIKWNALEGLQVKWLHSISQLTPYERSKVPQARLDWIKQIDEECKTAEKRQEVA